MVQDLFLNATILITFITLGNQIIKEYKFSCSSLRVKLITGVVGGILGSILMLYSVEIAPKIIVDFRNIAIIMSAILGGFIPSIVTSLIIGLFRILYFGVTPSSIAVLVNSIIMSLGCSFIISKTISPIKKWIYSGIFCTLCTSIVIVIFVVNRASIVNILLVYWIGTFLLIVTLERYTNYLDTSNQLFRKYKEEASKDFLTGLNNVRQFDKIYNKITSELIEKQESLSLLYIDIDFFKKVNDTYGHAEGDVVLREFSKILLKTARSFDIVSRNGGEEFSVMLLDCSSEQALNIAERVRLNVAEHEFVLSSGEIIKITISIGVATYPDTTKDFSKLIEEADKALYKAKHSGRNMVIFAKQH